MFQQPQWLRNSVSLQPRHRSLRALRPIPMPRQALMTFAKRPPPWWLLQGSSLNTMGPLSIVAPIHQNRQRLGTSPHVHSHRATLNAKCSSTGTRCWRGCGRLRLVMGVRRTGWTHREGPPEGGPSYPLHARRLWNHYCGELAARGPQVFTLSTRQKPPLSRGLSGGRYWDRTSDLCRVKAALSR